MTGYAATALLAAGIIVAFYMAWSVGANDVANAMGTSVGSKALTLRNAIIVAAIFEFTGAFLLGGSVSDTVRRGIVNPELFAGTPELLAYGMLAALLASAIWLHLASAFGMPVSTTHSIVGAVAGFGVLQFGASAVDWGMMVKIVLSWFISPAFGALLGFLMFTLVRRMILDQDDPQDAVVRRIPYLFFIVFATLAFSLLVKGMKGALPADWDVTVPKAAMISVVIGIPLAVVSTVLVRRRARGRDRSEPYVFVEGVFVYLQILTACYVALAHGANDVANAVGPLAAIAHIVKVGTVEMKVAMPAWILAVGGAGIVLGLATYGYRVMLTVGTKIVEMSPSRGFAAEFGAATTVLICSLQGLPISTTHTLVGAVVGVGIARGMGALNYRVLYGIAASWLITVPAAAMMSMIIFAILKALFL
jgi:inorganic phosphate transporter, PiT family